MPIAVDRVVKRFEKKSESLSSVPELVDFAFSFSSFGISAKPVQNRSEIIEFCELLKAKRVASLLEIGTDRGGTLFLLSRIAGPTATIVSVNLPYSSLNAWCMRYRNRLYRRFALKGQRIHLLTADSHKSGTVDEVKTALHGQKLDFLFIDGDHSYEGVRRDFEMYSPLVGKGGIIGLHDITNNDTVGRYWQELKKGYKHKEIEHTKGPGLGIGLVYM
ncbi:MAG: class I SAM-dependent methyltransferase [Candidatus Micrarchaeota archaeon]|nr:class I SAM-dependent methyltransferase [Candidatus Micrarchaeota archaeon]